MPRRRAKSHAWVYLIWGINGLAIVSLFSFSIFYQTDRRASAADEIIETARPAETRKIPPTSYYLPTLTPNPFYTPPVFETSTPFVLARGRALRSSGFRLPVVRLKPIPSAWAKEN